MNEEMTLAADSELTASLSMWYMSHRSKEEFRNHSVEAADTSKEAQANSDLSDIMLLPKRPIFIRHEVLLADKSHYKLCCYIVIH